MKCDPSYHAWLRAGACLLLGACQAQPTAPAGQVFRLQTLHNGAACGTERTSLSPVPDAGSLARIILAGGLLGAETQNVGVDFTRQSVFQLSMGQQRSAGATLGVVAANLSPGEHRLTVNALWQPADPGRMHAMVVMRPCVVFAVPRGDYRSVRVVDAQQEEKFAVDLPGSGAPQ